MMIALLPIAFGGCFAQSIGASEVERYTGLRFCDDAVVHDLTTPVERDTTPGYSFHVVVDLPRACRADFVAQVAKIAGSSCQDWSADAQSCFIDSSRRSLSRKPTSISVTKVDQARYDLRFYS